MERPLIVYMIDDHDKVFSQKDQETYTFNNFRNTYRHNTVKSYVLRSYNSSVNHHSATSGSGSSSHSSGGSSGGGHGGGGGGSW